MTVDQQWALNSLRHLRNSAVLTLSGLVLLNSDAVHLLHGKQVVLRPGKIIFNADPSDCAGSRLEVPLSQILADYEHDSANYVASLTEQWKYARRNVLKESFEVGKAYASQAGCLPALRAASWYSYARVMRNSVSHDMHFRFRSYDLRELPVSYLGIVIDVSLQDTPVLDTHLDSYVVLTMLQEIASFVASP